MTSRTRNIQHSIIHKLHNREVSSLTYLWNRYIGLCIVIVFKIDNKLTMVFRFRVRSKIMLLPPVWRRSCCSGIYPLVLNFTWKRWLRIWASEYRCFIASNFPGSSFYEFLWFQFPAISWWEWLSVVSSYLHTHSQWTIRRRITDSYMVRRALSTSCIGGGSECMLRRWWSPKCVCLRIRTYTMSLPLGLLSGRRLVIRS